jgi:hypothetical protein
MMEENGVGAEAEDSSGTTFLRKSRTWNISLRLARAYPSPPTTRLIVNLSLLPFQGVTRRNVDEKEALSITKFISNGVQIWENRRTDVFIHRRILPQPLRKRTPTTPRIQNSVTQDCSMAETLPSKIIDAKFEDSL